MATKVNDIVDQVAARYGEQIKNASSHNLLHILRGEKADGTPMPIKKNQRAAVEALKKLADKELQERGYTAPDFSSFFLLCNH